MSLKAILTILASVTTVSVVAWSISSGGVTKVLPGKWAQKSETRASMNMAELNHESDDPDEVIASEPGGLAVILERPVEEANVEEVEGMPVISAVKILRSAASEGNKDFLNEIRGLPKNCKSCTRFFSDARTLMGNADLSYDEKAFIAQALAASGRAENQAFLVQQLNTSAKAGSQAASDGQETDAQASTADEILPPAAIGHALESEKLVPEVVDELDASLESDNPYIRDAALSILTKQGSLEAIQKLHEFTVEQNDPDGFYSDGMGIGKLVPSEEAFSYLEGLVRNQDAYSHLALKALMNAGEKGREQAIALLQEIPAEKANKDLIKNAVDHWPLYGKEYSDVQKLVDSGNPTIRQFANQVVAEHLSQEAEKNKKFELNEYSDLGLVNPQPAGSF